MSGEFEAELAELVALTNEHLRWERTLGHGVLPDLRGQVVAERSANAEPEAPPSSAPPPEPGAERLVEPPPPEVTLPGATSEDAVDPVGRLRVLADEAAACTRCKLHRGRTNSVFARGNPGAEVVFVGEGPGYHEDQSGVPFVGKAGQLLDRMIDAMGLGPDEIYICNVVKCRPPENRTPTPDEAAACLPFLQQQLAVVRPKVIVALGRHAAENLGCAPPGQKWRGQWRKYEEVPVMSTYHPAYLLRSPEQKRPVWEDLQAVVASLGRQVKAR